MHFIPSICGSICYIYNRGMGVAAPSAERQSGALMTVSVATGWEMPHGGKHQDDGIKCPARPATLTITKQV